MLISSTKTKSGAAMSFAAALSLALSACGASSVETQGDEEIQETTVESTDEASAPPTSESLYESVLSDYTFTEDVTWDAESEEYVGEEALDDSDVAAVEELLLLIDSYDKATASVDHVTAEHVDSLRPHLTDRLYEMRSEGVVYREDNELVQDGDVKIERMLVTNYVPNSEANVSVCRDYSEYGLTSATSPDKNVTIDFTEDVREMTAVRADGRWILLGEQQSEYTCDDIRTAS